MHGVSGSSMKSNRSQIRRESVRVGRKLTPRKDSSGACLKALGTTPSIAKPMLA